ncbi:MAG: hypothetical protein AAB244_01615 [Nitrospirota bacterium]
MKWRWLKNIFIFTILTLCLFPAETYPAKAKIPIDIDIYIDGVYKVGGEIVITVTTRPLLPAPKIKIAINLPEGLELKAGETTWEGSMSKEEERDIEVSVKILKEGLFDVIGVASIEYPDGSRLVKSASGTIEVGQYKKPEQPGIEKKDRKGREIIEFE